MRGGGGAEDAVVVMGGGAEAAAEEAGELAERVEWEGSVPVIPPVLTTRGVFPR